MSIIKQNRNGTLVTILDTSKVLTTDSIGDGLDVGDDGKLIVDFNDLNPQQIEKIVKSMIDPDGGLVGNPNATIPPEVTYHVYNPETDTYDEYKTTTTIPNPNKSKLAVDFGSLSLEQREKIVKSMIDPDGAVVGNTDETLPPGAKYHIYNYKTNQYEYYENTTGEDIPNPNRGKLTVDFEKLDDKQIERIVNSMIDPSGPITASGSTIKKGEKYVTIDSEGNRVVHTATRDMENQYAGRLTVDFSLLPDERFNDLRSSLGMQRQLTGPTIFYVDYDNINASDEVRLPNSTGGTIFDSTRGLSLAKSFKTIGGAVKAITENYSLGTYNVSIRVYPRTRKTIQEILDTIPSNDDGTIANIVQENLKTYPYYVENISLPSYTTTSGQITITGYTGGKVFANGIEAGSVENALDMPRILNKSFKNTEIVASGGSYTLQYLDIYQRLRDPSNNIPNYTSMMTVYNNSSVSVKACKEHVEFYGEISPYGSFSFNVSTEPTIIFIQRKDNFTDGGKVQVVEAGEYLNWEYMGYGNRKRPGDSTSTVGEIERERPQINIANDGLLTIVDYTYNNTTQTVTLKYTFKKYGTATSNKFSYNVYVDIAAKDIPKNSTEAKNIPIAFTHEIIPETYTETVNNETVTYEANVTNGTSLHYRMHSIANGGKLNFDIYNDNCNTYFFYNTHSRQTPEEYFKPVQLDENVHFPENLYIAVLRAERQGQIESSSTSTYLVPSTFIVCKGNATNFLELSVGSTYSDVTGGTRWMRYVAMPLTESEYNNENGVNFSNLLSECLVYEENKKTNGSIYYTTIEIPTEQGGTKIMTCADIPRNLRTGFKYAYPCTGRRFNITSGSGGKLTRPTAWITVRRQNSETLEYYYEQLWNMSAGKYNALPGSTQGRIEFGDPDNSPENVSYVSPNTSCWYNES